MNDEISKYLSTDLFSFREVVVISLSFVFIILTTNRIFNYMDNILFSGGAGIPLTWPISVFGIHFGWEGRCVSIAAYNVQCASLSIYLTTIILTAIVFLLSSYYIISKDAGIIAIIFSGILLVLLTNAYHGYEGGYINPIAGGSIQYYHDAIKINDATSFLSNFESLQPELLVHSRTHPPGAVLLFHFLDTLYFEPGHMSIIISITTVTVSLYYSNKLFNIWFPNHLSKYLTYLFSLIPSIQIYYLASLNAVVATLVISSIYYFVQENRLKRILGTTICIGLLSFIQFVSPLFLIAVAFLYSLVKDKPLTDVFVLFSSIILIYTFIYAAFGFNYLNSFMIASALENPDGFRLFAEPISYIFTRIEGVVEILVFMTPFLVVLLWRGAINTTYSEVIDNGAILISIIASLILLAMFGAGVYRTGETARAANFIYPFLFLIIGVYFHNYEISDQSKYLLAALVFGQSMMMQIVGFYFW